jgi:hypothetical protein
MPRLILGLLVFFAPLLPVFLEDHQAIFGASFTDKRAGL